MKWKLIINDNCYEYFPCYQGFLDALNECPDGKPARKLRGTIPALQIIKYYIQLSNIKNEIKQELMASEVIGKDKLLNGMKSGHWVSPQLFHKF